MGADGLSTKVGPYGGAANPLGPHDLNTVQSLLENKEYVPFFRSLSSCSSLSQAHMSLLLTLAISLTQITL